MVAGRDVRRPESPQRRSVAKTLDNALRLQSSAH